MIKSMSVHNEYEDEYYESSDVDMIHFDEEYDEETGAKPLNNHNTLPTHKKKFIKKKKRLEDWLEEKRLRDELRDDTLDS